MSINIKPFVFLILNGWGIAPESSVNAISQARTPNFDRLTTNYQTFSLASSGNDVGLLKGQPGDTKSGYLNLGAGKVVYEILPKINVAIEDRSFFENKAFISVIENCLENESALHLIGQISTSQKHSSKKHLYALIDLARSKGVEEIYLHLILDGVESEKFIAVKTIKEVQDHLDQVGVGQIATVHGLYYGMNRDGHWDMTEESYRAIVDGKSENVVSNIYETLQKFYDQEIYDDEIPPTVISRPGKASAGVKVKDSIIAFNYRADRLRQLAKAFADKDFDKFKTKKLTSNFYGMIKYCPDIEMKYAFDKSVVEDTLVTTLNGEHIKQTYYAEPDKMSQLIAFWRNNFKSNSQIEDIEIAEKKISKKIVQEIVDEKIEFSLVNFALADKEADSGNFKKTIKAVEKIDSWLGKIADAVIAKNGVLMIGSTHGNIEEFASLQSGKIDKQNTTNPVPFTLVGKKWGQDKELSKGKLDLSLIKPTGSLANVAPTILNILGIKKPKSMKAKSLI